jgi:hypothetical protein
MCIAEGATVPSSAQSPHAGGDATPAGDGLSCPVERWTKVYKFSQICRNFAGSVRSRLEINDFLIQKLRFLKIQKKI